MKRVKRSAKKKAVGILSLIAAASVPHQSAFAEDFPAAKNQFIVEFSEAVKRNPASLGIAGSSLLASMAGTNSFSPINVVEIDGDGKLVPPSAHPVIANVPSDPDFCQRLVESGAAKSCSPNFQVKTQALPNEAGVGSQYWHQAIDSSLAWDVTTGNDTAVVAVLDTGVDYRHPDLAENMWVNSGEIAGNGIDDDGNGVVDDIHGYNGERNDGDPLDDGNHGSHVAGIIGARGNNGIGVAGVAWRTKIMALKFITAAGWGFTSDAIEGMDYMVAMKRRGVNVRVVNNSWGGGGYSKPLEDAIRRVNDAGIIFTAAAGNSGSDNDVLPQYPASYNVPNIVSVAASDEHNALTGFSCFGRESVHISAPGSQILSTITSGRYQAMSGTSMATPFVTGALGLLLSRESGLTVSQAINRLLTSATFQTDQEGLTTTSRMLNVNNLIRNLPGATPPEGEVCQYEVSQVAFAPNLGVDSAPIIQPAAGTTYYSKTQVNLPFNFPFFGKTYNKMHINVNGIVQFENASEAWEFRGGAFAPRFSIAPLYTYLYDYPAALAPLGVRLKTSADRVDVRWELAHPWNPSVGTVKINLTIFPNGNIETHLSIPNDRLAKTLGYGSIVGIRGSNLANSHTATANNFPVVIRGNLAFKFARPQSCSASAVEVVEPTPTPSPEPTIADPSQPTPVPTASPEPGPDSAKISKMTILGRGGKSGEVKTRSSYLLRVASAAQGKFRVMASLNGRQCTGSVELTATSRLNSFKIVMPRVGSKFKKLSLTSGGRKATATIKGERLQGPRNNTLKAGCQAVMAKLKNAVRVK